MQIKSNILGAELRTTFKLLLLSILIGLLCAGAGVLFFLFIELSEHYLLGSITPSFPHSTALSLDWSIAWTIPIVVGLGGLLSGLLSHYFAPETFGGGENAVIEAYHQRNGIIRKRVPIVKALASAITLGTGGSAGREGPMAQISAGIGGIVCRWAKVDISQQRILIIAGTAAGISAVFRTPLGAAFLATETLYSKLELESDSLIYSVISASVAYAAAGFYFGWAPLFSIPANLAFKNGFDLFWFAALGLFAGIVSIVIPEIFTVTKMYFEKLDYPRWLRPAIGGFLVGFIAMFFPGVLGAGYSIIQSAIDGTTPLYILLSLGIAKIICFSLTVGSGGSGGVFAPVLFAGAVFGSAFTILFESLTTGGPGTASMVIVSMAAFYGGIARAPIAAVILTTELTGGYGLIVPAMIAVSLACLIEPLASHIFNRKHSLLYSAQVEDHFESPTHHMRYVNAGINLITTKGEALNEPVSLPDIDHLIRLSKPIPVGNSGRFIYRTTIHSKSPIVSQQISALDFLSDILIVSIFRGEEQITPRGSTTLMDNDSVILICKPEVINQVRNIFELQ